MGRFVKGLAALALLTMSWAVMAADPAAPATTAATVPATAPVVSSALSSGIGGQLLQLVLGLLLVVGLIFVLAWLMRRVQRAGPAGNQVIELVGSRALGPRDRLVLVQVGNEHVMNEPVQVPETQNTTPEFARRLMDVLGNKGITAPRPGKNGLGEPGQKDKN